MKGIYKVKKIEWEWIDVNRHAVFDYGCDLYNQMFRYPAFSLRFLSNFSEKIEKENFRSRI